MDITIPYTYSAIISKGSNTEDDLSKVNVQSSLTLEIDVVYMNELEPAFVIEHECFHVHNHGEILGPYPTTTGRLCSVEDLQGNARNSPFYTTVTETTVCENSLLSDNNQVIRTTKDHKVKSITEFSKGLSLVSDGLSHTLHQKFNEPCYVVTESLVQNQVRIVVTTTPDEFSNGKKFKASELEQAKNYADSLSVKTGLPVYSPTEIKLFNNQQECASHD